MIPAPYPGMPMPGMPGMVMPPYPGAPMPPGYPMPPMGMMMGPPGSMMMMPPGDFTPVDPKKQKLSNLVPEQEFLKRFPVRISLSLSHLLSTC